jgi:hypothetical protein
VQNSVPSVFGFAFIVQRKLYGLYRSFDLKADERKEGYAMEKDRKLQILSTAITDEEAAELRTPKGENL